MPGMDRTGPLGMGSRTGRGMGPCGRGFRRGFGRGLGFRQMYQEPVTLNKTDEKKILQEELKEIELEKKEIEKRLKEIK